MCRGWECIRMSFWNLLLVGGVITWTACVFLRAVATRTGQLRAELVPVQEEPDPSSLADDGPITLEPVGSPEVAEVLSSPHPSGNGNGKMAGNGMSSGNGKAGSNGNGHGKVPLKRPGL